MDEGMDHAVRQRRLGRYEVVRQIGTGGMAVAFLCERSGVGGFKKSVVAKLIRPEHASNDGFLRMFLDEARNAASLSHSNIAQVFEIDHIGRCPYIIMEYVHGPSVLAMMRASHQLGKMHYGHVARILAAACRGLQAAHDAGVVHRDVTLQNILVASNGQTKLIDFGIAKAQGSLQDTQIGVLKGKVQYMSPEGLEHGKVDHRADVYSVGVCLYRGTVGRHPFRGQHAAGTMANILKARLVRPSEIVEGYPPHLEAIVLRALSRDPDDRFASASEMARALESFAMQPPWACDDDGLASLIEELFPQGEAQWTEVGNPWVTSDDLLASLEAIPNLVPPPLVPRHWIFVGALAGVLALGIAAVGAWVAGGSIQDEGVPTNDVVASEDSWARTTLDLAEELQDLDPARAAEVLALLEGSVLALDLEERAQRLRHYLDEASGEEQVEAAPSPTPVDRKPTLRPPGAEPVPTLHPLAEDPGPLAEDGDPTAPDAPRPAIHVTR